MVAKVKNKIIIGSLILIVLVVSITIPLAYPKIEEYRINSAIEDANYCEEDSDCVDAGGKCPFGCYAYVNKDKVEDISEMIQSYESECVYGCVSCPTAVCEDNICEEVCES